MTALADPGRCREHDNPRDERGHAGIQQDFIENSNHGTLHTRLCLRAAFLGRWKYLGRRSVTNWLIKRPRRGINRAVTICAALPAGTASTPSQTLAACASPRRAARS